jgi:protein-disulfide isomerase
LPTHADSPTLDDQAALLPVTPQTPIWGSESALVTVVLFGDLDCPYTRFSIRTLARIKQEMPTDLRLVFRHRPLTPGGPRLAAFAARLHDSHGAPAFWRFASLVSRESEAVSSDFITGIAPRLGLAPAEALLLFGTSDEPLLKADWDWSVRFAVRKTPTLFVNGKRSDELLNYDQLTQLVHEARRAQLSLLAQGIKKQALYRHRVQNTLVGLGSQAPERFCVPLGDAPLRGALDRASVTIVEFSDFECGYCAELQRTLARLLSAFPGQLQLAWKNFPLAVHPGARSAANLALHGLVSGGRETFWSVHDGLYQSQLQLDASTFTQLLDRLGLDAKAYIEASRQGTYDARIDDDLELAERLGVDGVPTLFVNGRKVEGAQSFGVLEALVKEELRAMAHLNRAGFRAEHLTETLCSPQ